MLRKRLALSQSMLNSRWFLPRYRRNRRKIVRLPDPPEVETTTPLIPKWKMRAPCIAHAQQRTRVSKMEEKKCSPIPANPRLLSEEEVKRAQHAISTLASLPLESLASTSWPRGAPTQSTIPERDSSSSGSKGIYT